MKQKISLCILLAFISFACFAQKKKSSYKKKKRNTTIVKRNNDKEKNRRKGVVEVFDMYGDNAVFTKVEVPPQFPGGQSALDKYIKKNLNTSVATKNKAPKGEYEVNVKFIVHKDGTLSDFKSESNVGFGMEDELIRVLKMGPKWISAMQNGRAVNAYAYQKATFVVK